MAVSNSVPQNLSTYEGPSIFSSSRGTSSSSVTSAKTASKHCHCPVSTVPAKKNNLNNEPLPISHACPIRKSPKRSWNAQSLNRRWSSPSTMSYQQKTAYQKKSLITQNPQGELAKGEMLTLYHSSSFPSLGCSSWPWQWPRQRKCSTENKAQQEWHHSPTPPRRLREVMVDKSIFPWHLLGHNVQWQYPKIGKGWWFKWTQNSAFLNFLPNLGFNKIGSDSWTQRVHAPYKLQITHHEWGLRPLRWNTEP